MVILKIIHKVLCKKQWGKGDIVDTFLQRSGLICTTFLFTSLVCMHFWRPNFALVLLWWFSSTNFSWWIILIVAFKIRLHLIKYVLLIFLWSCACLKSNFLAIGTQRKIIVAHLPISLSALYFNWISAPFKASTSIFQIDSSLEKDKITWISLHIN